MAINKNKPVYVFNQIESDSYTIGWYKWNQELNNFIKIETPTLSKNFAGIGTSSNTTEQGNKLSEMYMLILLNLLLNHLLVLKENILLRSLQKQICL